MCLSVCPMKHNREQIPKLVSFANKLNIDIYFNNMWYPENLSIFNLDYESKSEIIESWKQAHTKFKHDIPSQKNNAKIFNALINQVEQSVKKEKKQSPLTSH